MRPARKGPENRLLLDLPLPAGLPSMRPARKGPENPPFHGAGDPATCLQ